MGVKITVQTVADHLAGSYCQEASGVYHFYAHVVAGDNVSFRRTHIDAFFGRIIGGAYERRDG